MTGEPDVGKIVQIGRLGWADHLAMMGTDKNPNKLINDMYAPVTLPRGRPELRWLDGVKEDSRILLGIQNWRVTALNLGQNPVMACCAD